MLGLALASFLVGTLPDGGGAACEPVAGAEALWAKPETRFVVVGELHGTAEAPRAVANLACAASRSRPVNVGVEAQLAFRPALDAYLASDGSEAARRAFLRDGFWTAPFKDGRSSQAMLAMIEELRRLRRAGRDISVFPFQPEKRPPGFDRSFSELKMAALIADGARAKPDALVLVLVGNLHARKTGDRSVYLPALAHIRPELSVSVLAVHEGGSAWNCVDTCGARAVGRGHAPGLRGVVLEPQDGGAYDGLLALGVVTASPPAVP